MVIPDNFFDVEFNKAMAFGYKTEDVDEFVTKAIEIIKGLQEENAELTEKMGVLAATVEKYREDEDSLRSALIGAQKLGDSILKDSRSKAEVILRDATNKADHIVEEAHTRLKEETAEYERIKAEVTAFREGLISMYKAHIDQICKIPHYEKTGAKSVQAAPQVVPAPEPEPEQPVEQPKEEALPVLKVEEETPVQPAKQPAEPPARKQPFRLEVEDVEEEDNEPADDAILSRFSGKVGRLMARREQEDDFGDEDDDDETPITAGKTIFSSKFGEMRFGESFSLTPDEKGSGGRSSGRGRR
jgi:cell division initiation protein